VIYIIKYLRRTIITINWTFKIMVLKNKLIGAYYYYYYCGRIEYGTDPIDILRYVIDTRTRIINKKMFILCIVYYRKILNSDVM